MRNLEEFNNKYKNEPCFIVGAGPSIALYEDLEPLKKHLTIAVNSGYVAVPFANYFISDDQGISHYSYFKGLKSAETIVLLYEDKLKKCANWFGKRSVLFRHRKGIHIPDIYSHTNPKNHLGETRSSLGSAIMVANTMGCSPIYLLGVDCCRYNGFRYFWQISSKYSAPYRDDNVPLDFYQKCRTYGEVTDFDLLDILKSWYNFGRAVNKKCLIYNCSLGSKLTIFPKVKLEDVISRS